jgi:hypothetical protein
MTAAIHFEKMNKNHAGLTHFRIALLVLLFFSLIHDLSAQSKKKQIEELQKQIDSLETVISTQKSQISDLDFNLKKTSLENEQNQKMYTDSQAQMKTLQRDLDLQTNTYQKALQNLQQTIYLREKQNIELDKENDSLRNLSISHAKKLSDDYSEEASSYYEIFELLNKTCSTRDIQNAIIQERCSLASEFTGAFPSVEMDFINPHFLAIFIGDQMNYGEGNLPFVGSQHLFDLHKEKKIFLDELISVQNQKILLEMFNSKFNNQLDFLKNDLDFANGCLYDIPEQNPFENLRSSSISSGLFIDSKGISMDISYWPWHSYSCNSRFDISLSWEEVRPYVPSTFYE